MQPVLDREVLQIAQPGIDAAERVDRVRRGVQARFARKPRPLRRVDDQLREALAAARVEPVRLRVFVDQALQFTRIAGKPGRRERRRQMADRDRRDAPLGLRRLARIADDEGIDDRRGPDHRFGKAGARERDRLAGQPFERAMRAHMDERVDHRDMPQPQAEGDERMARRKLRIVVVGATVGAAPAVGRQRDQDIAEPAGAEAEDACAHIRIVRGIAPRVLHARGRLRGQIAKKPRVFVER